MVDNTKKQLASTKLQFMDSKRDSFTLFVIIEAQPLLLYRQQKIIYLAALPPKVGIHLGMIKLTMNHFCSQSTN